MDEKKKIDFNEIMDAENLKAIQVGKCVPTQDGQILACRISEEEWEIRADTAKLRGKVRIKL